MIVRLHDIQGICIGKKTIPDFTTPPETITHEGRFYHPDPDQRATRKMKPFIHNYYEER